LSVNGGYPRSSPCVPHALGGDRRLQNIAWRFDSDQFFLKPESCYYKPRVVVEFYYRFNTHIDDVMRYRDLLRQAA
jgi:hypothetical protein